MKKNLTLVVFRLKIFYSCFLGARGPVTFYQKLQHQCTVPNITLVINLHWDIKVICYEDR